MDDLVDWPRAMVLLNNTTTSDVRVEGGERGLSTFKTSTSTNTGLDRGMFSKGGGVEPACSPAKREHLERFEGLLPEGQGQILALSILYVPYSLDIGVTCLTRPTSASFSATPTRARYLISLFPVGVFDEESVVGMVN